jgi:excisionase family DNA binding protein
VSARKATGPELLAALQAGELAFVSVAEFARILRVSAMLIYRQIEAGALEVNQVGPRLIRIPAGAALAYIKESKERRVRPPGKESHGASSNALRHH